MGFGGILAAMAQGLGGGMIKVADEGWKKQAKDREREHDFALAEKKHQYDLEIINAKHKSKLGIMAAEARQKISPNEGDMTYTKDNFAAADIKIKELTATEELLASTPKDSSEYKMLLNKKNMLVQDITTLGKDKRTNEIIAKGHLGKMIEAEYHQKYGAFLERYKPDPVEIEKTVPKVNHPKATVGVYSSGQGFKTQTDTNYGNVSYGAGLR